MFICLIRYQNQVYRRWIVEDKIKLNFMMNSSLLLELLWLNPNLNFVLKTDLKKKQNNLKIQTKFFYSQNL